VEPADANAMALSLYRGQRVMLDQVGGFADGVAVKVVGEETFRLCRELVDGIVLVSRDAICASIKVRNFLVLRTNMRLRSPAISYNFSFLA
jgi:threonine dehydratase